MAFQELDILALAIWYLNSPFKSAFPSVLPVHYHTHQVALAILGPHSYGYFISASIQEQLRANLLQQTLVAEAAHHDGRTLTAVGILIVSTQEADYQGHDFSLPIQSPSVKGPNVMSLGLNRFEVI